MNLPAEIFEVANRLAAQSGATVAEVVNSYMKGTRKTLLTRSDFLLGDSDISLCEKKVSRRVSSGRLPTGFTVVRG